MDLQKRWINFLIIVEAVVLVLVLGIGLLSYGNRKIADNKEQKEQDSTEDMAQQGTTEEPEKTEPEFSQAVLSLLENMTMEEKVAQLFVISPEALTGADRVTVARTMSQDAFKTYPVGGLVFSDMNYEADSQFQTLINGYQGFSEAVLGVKLFVAGSALSEQAASLGVNINLADLFTVEAFEPALVEALREEQGYHALIYSGDLSSANVTGTYEGGQAAVAAVKAGVDVLYNPVDFKAAYSSVLEAVRSGEIESSVLQNAVGRILSAKLQ